MQSEATAERVRTLDEVLGVPVHSDLVSTWRGWFAPPVQPFPIHLLRPDVAADIPDHHMEPTAEWIDTFFMYAGNWSWLDEVAFLELAPGHRRSLLAARRKSTRPKKVISVWPTELDAAGDQLMFDWISSSVRSSRHRSVGPRVWDRATQLLPDAHRLAGTFAGSGSGANCFGTVMAAAGEPVEDKQVSPEPFGDWLSSHTEPVEGTEHDAEPGVVFVWTEHGELAHATVTVGAGWMLTKPSQSWSSPRMIWTVREAVNSWRYPETRLSRHRLRR